VFQFAIEHVRNDFHIAVWVRAKSLRRLYPIVVYYPQFAKSHVLGIIEIGKRKAVFTVQPAVVGVAAVCRSSDFQHTHYTLART
jgi:hypothetical protein